MDCNISATAAAARLSEVYYREAVMRSLPRRSEDTP